MIICIDIGNTNIVLGIYKNDELLESFRLQTNIYQTVDEYGVKLRQLIDATNFKSENIEGIIISSVVPQIDRIIEKAFDKYFNKKVMFVGPGVKNGINIRLENPKQLGADILVGAVAAVNKYQCPVIVIDMGTAISICYVNSKKELLGGVILPGIKTSYNALFQRASKLEEVGIERPKNVVGNDTITSLQSGMTYGMASCIDGLVKKIQKEQGESQVVITGGEARFVLDSLESKVIYDENLLLEGLKIIYQKNSK